MRLLLTTSKGIPSNKGERLSLYYKTRIEVKVGKEKAQPRGTKQWDSIRWRGLQIHVIPVDKVEPFWRLASQVGSWVSKLPSASVKSQSIRGPNGGEAGPLLQILERGESPFHSRSSTTNYLSPNMITNEDRELRRQKDETNPLVLIGTIEERKRMVAPFAQGASSRKNVGDRVRTFRWLRPLS
ncbi:unnamed protein product [Lupinus luteus]|uniref:Uncharacterized protein n=1 Tax=Lupinus luteus TaxID=3873 RepID=A0AAV1XV82_LUPLU